MPDPEWIVKRERGGEAITLQQPQTSIQAYCEAQIAADPSKGGAIVYQRYAMCVPSSAVTWTISNTPPVAP